MRYIGVLAALGFLLAAAGSTMADSVWPDNLEGFWGLAQPEGSDSWRFTVAYGIPHSATDWWYMRGTLLQARVVPVGTPDQFLLDASPGGYPKITCGLAGWTNYADYGDVSVISGGTPFTSDQYPQFKFQFNYGDGPGGSVTPDPAFVLQLQMYGYDTKIGESSSPPYHLINSAEFYFDGNRWYWYPPSGVYQPTGLGAPAGYFNSDDYANSYGGTKTGVGAWDVTSPVPEPVTMAGLMLGIGGLVGYVRRRRG